jgi:hypothetical protein
MLDRGFVGAGAQPGAEQQAAGETKKGQGSRIMALGDAPGRPIAATLASANPAEVKGVEQTLAACLLDEKAERLIGDKAYQADQLEADLAGHGLGGDRSAAGKARPSEPAWAAVAAQEAEGETGAVLCRATTLPLGDHAGGGEGGNLLGICASGLCTRSAPNTPVNACLFVARALPIPAGTGQETAACQNSSGILACP